MRAKYVCTSPTSFIFPYIPSGPFKAEGDPPVVPLAAILKKAGKPIDVSSESRDLRRREAVLQEPREDGLLRRTPVEVTAPAVRNHLVCFDVSP